MLLVYPVGALVEVLYAENATLSRPFVPNREDPLRGAGLSREDTPKGAEPRLGRSPPSYDAGTWSTSCEAKCSSSSW
jgi:hypothetical protein